MSIERPRTLPVRDFLEMGVVQAVVQISRSPRPEYRVLFRLRLLNASGSSVRLVGRKWTLRDRAGNTRIIEAAQVFNQQPVLTPGAVFACDGMQTFETAPAGMEVRFFGLDQRGIPFITPSLIFPRSTFSRR